MMPEAVTAPLVFVGDATPYSYIGDSHAGIGTLLFDDAATGTRIATRTYLIWGLTSGDVLDAEGFICEVITETLRRCSALHSSPHFYPPVPGLRSVMIKRGDQSIQEFLKITDLSREQPHVFCIGELDVRNLLARFADDEIDFDVPFLLNGLDALPEYRVRATVPFLELLPVVLKVLTPLFQGLRILREAGLETMFLHCLPPPSLNDRAFAKVMGFYAPARLRYKLTMLVNFLYERACRELDIGFINTWGAVTDQNLRRSDFELDVVHLNRHHAILSVQEVHRQFYSRAKKGDHHA